MTRVQKLKISIHEPDEEKREEKYKFLYNSRYAQYLGLNRAMGFLGSHFYSMEEDALNMASKALKNSNPIFQDIAFGKGIDTKSAIVQKVKKDFSADLKLGLAKGERSLRNYKRDFPIMTRGRNLQFYEDNGKYYIKWVNKIVFRVLVGRKDSRYKTLIKYLDDVVAGNLEVQQSTIGFDSDNKLVLNLSTKADVNNTSLCENDGLNPKNIVGVDLGMNVPAYVVVGNRTFKNKAIGTGREVLKQRMQFKNRRKRVFEQKRNSKRQKSTEKKLRCSKYLSQKERKWMQSYNHFISKRVVEFALFYGCGTIHLEKLSYKAPEEKVLDKWTYHELQTYIEYKAAEKGIVVKYVDASYTSKKCHACSNEDKENRQSQERFKCVKCGLNINADLNAAINIARAEEIKKPKKSKKTEKEKE